MTSEGPLSMCMHNAKRDNYILRPIRLYRREADQFWNPILGTTGREPLEIAIDSLPAPATKRLKGKGRSRMKASEGKGRSRMKASAAEKTDA
jgi:hypothetical protein